MTQPKGNPATDVVPDLADVLAAHLKQRSDDEIADLCAAGRDIAEHAEAGHRIWHAAALDGGVVIEALNARGLSWRQIEHRTGIASRTARRWVDFVAECRASNR